MLALHPRRPSLLLRITGVAALSLATLACGSGAAPVASPSPASPAPSAPAPSAPSPSAPAVESPAPSLPSSDPAEPGATPIPAKPVKTPAPALPVIARDSIATVVTDDLRVRSRPGVSDDSELLEPLLDRGREVLVVDGPVEASGYTWYLVAPLGHLADQDLPVGWVAVADKDGEPWVQARDAECPEKPTTFGQLSTLEPLIALACFGDEEIEFTAQALRPEATCGVDLGWTIQPDWLGSTCAQPLFILTGPGGDGDLYTIIEPGTQIGDIEPGVTPDEAVDVVVRGHFDHEASGSCRIDVYEPEAGPGPDITDDEAIVICRSQFVVTSLEPAG